VIIVCQALHEDDLRRRFRQLSLQLKSLNVPLSVQLVTLENLSRGHHTLEGPLVAHLRRVAARDAARLKGDVLALLPPTEVTRQHVLDYVKRKYASLNEESMDPGLQKESLRCAFLKKVVEAPLHVARRHLDLMEYLGAGDDRGQRVIDLYERELSGELPRLFRAAHEANYFYDIQLRAQLTRFDPGAYHTVLEILRADYTEKTLKYLQSVMNHL
jgi:hypothetical protein